MSLACAIIPESLNIGCCSVTGLCDNTRVSNTGCCSVTGLCDNTSLLTLGAAVSLVCPVEVFQPAMPWRVQWGATLTSSRRHTCWRRRDWGSSPCTGDSQCRRTCACSIRLGRAASTATRNWTTHSRNSDSLMAPFAHSATRILKKCRTQAKLISLR